MARCDTAHPPASTRCPQVPLIEHAAPRQMLAQSDGSPPGLASSLASGLHIPSQTVEKLLFFARRVTLASSEIRFSVKIARRDPVAGRRRRWCVVGTNNSVPPVCVMHRSRDRRTAQGDQKAQGQNRTHRFFSNRQVAIRSGCSSRGRSLIRFGDYNADCFVVPGKSKWPTALPAVMQDPRSPRVVPPGENTNDLPGC